jgi:hypothetical protein
MYRLVPSAKGRPEPAEMTALVTAGVSPATPAVRRMGLFSMPGTSLRRHADKMVSMPRAVRARYFSVLFKILGF